MAEVLFGHCDVAVGNKVSDTDLSALYLSSQ